MKTTDVRSVFKEGQATILTSRFSKKRKKNVTK